ncbi:MAG: JmjC domain-containing protein, partial [Thermocrispum sp.]
MDHVLAQQVEQALGWVGPDDLGAGFARGSMPNPDLCPRLLTTTGLLDMAMRRSLNAPQFRCFQDGAEIHPGRFLTDSASRRGQSLRMADMPRLSRLLESGCTLVLDGADVFSPTLEVACRALQWWSREVVQVNCYLTTQSSDGFPLHWDDHDVLIVQLAGEKTWEVRGA